MSFLRHYRPARAVKPAHPIRPRLEVLEDRCVPSIDLVTSASGSAAVPGSLPFEVALAAKGDTIQFAANLKGATITLDNTLYVTQDLTVDGAGAGITVNGGGHRVFLIQLGVAASINALTITGGVIPNDAGGGILNLGSLTLSNCTVTGNSTVDGGGIFNGSSGTMTMSGDTVNGNTATLAGGGVGNIGQLTILNCTIASNNANSGGGIANSGVLKMANSTVAYNTVTGPGADGGGIYNKGSGSQLDLLNTIVFNPNSGAATENEVFGDLISTAQGDLFGFGTSGIASGGDLGGNKFNFNPLLGPLQNNGGPTATMALLSGSPAIGAGTGTSLISGLSVPSFDQRGNPRPAKNIDMGASQTSRSPIPGPSPSPSPSPAPGPTPGSGGSSFDPNEVAFDALLMADGLLDNNGLFVYLGLVDYFNLLGQLNSADQALAQAECYQDFSWCYSYISWDISWND
jgi:hypothetical protein